MNPKRWEEILLRYINMKNKIRIGFVIFIVLSFAILLIYNQNVELKAVGPNLQSLIDQEIAKAIAQRTTIIIYIFIVTSVCMLYLAYESYRVIYSELADRMEMLDASINDLQTTYNSVEMFMIEIDPDLTIININNALSENLNKKKSSIIGKKLNAMLGFSDKAMEELLSGVDKTFVQRAKQRIEIENNGKIFEAFISPLNDAKDRIKKVLLMLNDVTNARAIERQMLQDNKMIAVGQLAAGVAHEIRNPLGIIRNYCYILKNSGEYDRDVIEKAIASIEKAVDKSSRIIDNLLDFSRISNNKREWTNLYKFIKSIVFLEQNVLSTKNVNVSIICDKELEIYTIPESLEIIMINLIINAVDAMASGGDMTIKCLNDEEILKIQLTDTGTGIAETLIGSIFNPFFTTKEKRDGSGLGLYIVYNETEKLGGKIEVESRLGMGTSFILTFPLMRSGENDK